MNWPTSRQLVHGTHLDPVQNSLPLLHPPAARTEDGDDNGAVGRTLDTTLAAAVLTGATKTRIVKTMVRMDTAREARHGGIMQPGAGKEHRPSVGVCTKTMDIVCL